MKRIPNLFVLLMSVFLLTLTPSCEFIRKQQIKNADAKGKSTLVESESAKKAMIEEAKAKNESATLEAEAKVKIAIAEAQAEIERARGIAEANRIVGESLKGNKEYLEYLKIDAMKNAKGTIYIPTEASLPITEVRNIPSK